MEILILGAGVWGTALSIHLGHRNKNNNKIYLWDENSSYLEQLQKTRINTKLNINIELPPAIQVVNSSITLAEVFNRVQDILITVPSEKFQKTVELCKQYWQPHHRLLWGTKGIFIDNKHHHNILLLSDIAQSILGLHIPLAVLSGPTFATEVAQGLPTALTVASQDADFIKAIIDRFEDQNFQLEISQDLIGTQLGGALKNIYAIATGLWDGLNFGSNARCSLITQSLAEMARLATKIGAQPETLMGLSGLGDLILTCTDNQSRNRRFGLLLAQNLSINAALTSINQVVEGYEMIKKVAILRNDFKIQMPIASMLITIILDNIPIKTAIDKFLTR